MKQEEVSALMVLLKWNVEKVKIFVEKMMEKVAKLTNPTPYHDDFQKKKSHQNFQQICTSILLSKTKQDYNILSSKYNKMVCGSSSKCTDEMKQD